MSFSDPIGDMLTRVRNAAATGTAAAEMPHSRMKGEIAGILKREGYIRDYSVENDGSRKWLRIVLKYGPERKPVIQGLRRVSKPGLRKYVGVGDIPRVLGGMGTAILSTPAGIMSDGEARKRRVGGELLCLVW